MRVFLFVALFGVMPAATFAQSLSSQGPNSLSEISELLRSTLEADLKDGSATVIVRGQVLSVADVRTLLEAVELRRGLIAAGMSGLNISADQISYESGRLRAKGNVKITLAGSLITADEALVDNGEARISGSIRITLSDR